MPGINALLAAQLHRLGSPTPRSPAPPWWRPSRRRSPRRAAQLASGLRTLADRLAPEPVERSRWQGA